MLHGETLRGFDIFFFSLLPESQKTSLIFAPLFMGGEFQYKGIIREISEDWALVEVETPQGCSSCGAKSSCSIAKSPGKEVRINLPLKSTWKIGEEVIVCMNRQTASTASLMAHGVPILLLVVGVFLGVDILQSEEVGAGLGIGLVALWYLGLYSFRFRLGKRLQLNMYKSESIK